jgi:hypothetical protein
MADLISIVENMIEASKYKSFPDLPMRLSGRDGKIQPGQKYGHANRSNRKTPPND